MRAPVLMGPCTRLACLMLCALAPRPAGLPAPQGRHAVDPTCHAQALQRSVLATGQLQLGQNDGSVRAGTGTSVSERHSPTQEHDSVGHILPTAASPGRRHQQHGQSAQAAEAHPGSPSLGAEQQGPDQSAGAPSLHVVWVNSANVARTHPESVCKPRRAGACVGSPARAIRPAAATASMIRAPSHARADPVLPWLQRPPRSSS